MICILVRLTACGNGEVKIQLKRIPSKHRRIWSLAEGLKELIHRFHLGVTEFMSLPIRLISTSMILFGCIAMAPAAMADSSHWPQLLREALANDDKAQSYSLDSVIVQDDTEEVETIRYRLSRLADSKSVEILELPEDAKIKEVEEALIEDDEDIWCDDFRDAVGDQIELIDDTESSATFSFMVNPESAEEKAERKMLSKVRANITIDKANRVVTGFSYRLLEPVKPVMVAKINAFSVTGECVMSDFAGRPYAANVETHIEGSAMGRRFNQTTTQTVTNVMPLETGNAATAP